MIDRRCSGSRQSLRDLIRAKSIGTGLSGRVFHALRLPASLQFWRIHPAAAGGGIYPLSWSAATGWDVVKSVATAFGDAAETANRVTANSGAAR